MFIFCFTYLFLILLSRFLLLGLLKAHPFPTNDLARLVVPSALLGAVILAVVLIFFLVNSTKSKFSFKITIPGVLRFFFIPCFVNFFLLGFSLLGSAFWSYTDGIYSDWGLNEVLWRFLCYLVLISVLTVVYLRKKKQTTLALEILKKKTPFVVLSLLLAIGLGYLLPIGHPILSQAFYTTLWGAFWMLQIPFLFTLRNKDD